MSRSKWATYDKIKEMLVYNVFFFLCTTGFESYNLGFAVEGPFVTFSSSLSYPFILEIKGGKRGNRKMDKISAPPDSSRGLSQICNHSKRSGVGRIIYTSLAVAVEQQTTRMMSSISSAAAGSTAPDVTNGRVSSTDICSQSLDS